jgi:hypothetical protein
MNGSQGAARLSGSAWTSYTTVSTQSAPLALDGLASDSVIDVWVEPSGAIWFSTYAGASRLAGTTWTTFGPAQGLGSIIYGAWVSPAGDIYLGSSSSLTRLLP